MSKISSTLAALNTRFTARIGAALFLPAVTVLADKDFAKEVIHTILPHASDVVVTLLGVTLAGVAAFCLYQGKPEKTQ